MDKLNLSFALLIAYLVPGLLGALALGPDFSELNSSLVPPGKGLSASAVVPLLLLSLAVGVVLNAFFWAVIRNLIHATGVKRPDLRYWRLTAETMPTYQELVESNFRYYQAYSNLLGAVLITSISAGGASWPPRWKTLLVEVAVGCLLFAAARDSLARSWASRSSCRIPTARRLAGPTSC